MSTIPETALEEWKEKSKQIIDNIYNQYKDDPYMISKTNHYIYNQLPLILENIRQTRQQNVQRIEELSLEQEQFIHSFLNRYHYAYVPSTEKYVLYDGIHFSETVEDNILYHILNSISQERNPKLMSWKHKTKVSLLKRIKDTRLSKTIPESETIQSVLQFFYPSVFQSKCEAKYFLTVLGDNILKKNTNNIHFLTNHGLKLFLKEVNQASTYYFGTQCVHTFKTKCHEKHYEFNNKDCRMVVVQNDIKTEQLEIMIPVLLDILCVACHYSVRYGDADTYVSRELELENKIMKLTKITPDHLVDIFIKEYLCINADTNADTTVQMSWPNLLYLWKMFLQTHQYPSTLFQSVLKPIFTVNRFAKYYKSEDDILVGFCSSQWPVIQCFLRFWSETMVYDEFEMDLEIEEISGLFRSWGESVKWKNGYLSESQILDAISYFFPDVEIEKQKYIHRFRCNTWDKTLDIQVALQEMALSIKTTHPERIQTPALISIYDAYLFYCKFYSSPVKNSRFLVSKSYFDKYLMDQYGDYILEGGILSREVIEEL